MIRAVVAALLLAGCGTGAKPPTNNDAAATAAAERKAVADTDGAHRDAATPGTEQN